MQIRVATQADHLQIWETLRPVIRAGETFALPRDMNAQDALSFWCSPDKTTFVAELDDQIVGTYYLRTNQLGGGDHVCNCGYMTNENARGRGVAKAMGEHSLAYAREQGFRAIQFNFVVATNERAVALWQKLGFEIVGTSKGAYHHARLGFVDVYVMYQQL